MSALCNLCDVLGARPPAGYGNLRACARVLGAAAAAAAWAIREEGEDALASGE